MIRVCGVLDIESIEEIGRLNSEPLEMSNGIEMSNEIERVLQRQPKKSIRYDVSKTRKMSISKRKRFAFNFLTCFLVRFPSSKHDRTVS